MPNWRAHALEPFMTAAIIIGVGEIAWTVMLLASGGIGYLPIALYLGIFYPLIVALPWVAFTAMFSWLLRRRSHWLSLVAGGLASILLAGLAMVPVIVNAITSSARSGTDGAPVVASVIGVIVAVALVQFFVHLAIRARSGHDVTQEAN